MLASFSSQHLESHLHDPGNPLYDSITKNHALVHLAGLVPWADFDQRFGTFYRPLGRPARPTRLMVGLHYL